MASPSKSKSRKHQNRDKLIRTFVDENAGVCAHVYLKSAGRGFHYLSVVPERLWEHGKQTRYVADFFDYQIDALYDVAKQAGDFCRRHKDNPLAALNDESNNGSENESQSALAA